MLEKRSENKYGALAFLPIIIFLLLYVGCGIYFTVQGAEGPFKIMSRYVAVMTAICVAFLFFDRKTSLDNKFEIYSKGAGKSGVMLLTVIVLLAGAFSEGASIIGGKTSVVNIGLTLIPSSFLIPGIFIVACVISTCIGTSMGTQVAIIPVAVAIAQGAGLNVAMAGAATIAGSYFGDNLSIISDTTICATKGVGAEMKDKFRMNFLIALPAAILTIALYWFLSNNSAINTDLGILDYSVLSTLPYIIVLITAIAGLNIVLVLAIGIVMTGIIGIFTGTVGFFEWVMALSKGMEDMFFLAVFTSLISGLIELVKYYGGIEWLVESLKNKIKGRKSCEYFISLISFALSGAILNNTVAIIITAPIAKELGNKYRIAPKRLASLLDIFSCCVLALLPHDSGMLILSQYGKVSYIEMMHYAFYPILLMLFTIITIQFGLLRTKEEKENIA